MRPLDPRLLRYARSTRAYLVVTVVLGAVLAGLIVAQATLLADGITAVFLHGAGLGDLRATLIGLAVVIAGRAAVSWAQEAVAARSSASVKSELRLALLRRLAERPGAAETGGAVTLVVRGLDALDAYFARYLPQLVLAGLVPAIVLARILPADLIATVTIVLTLPLIPVFMALVGLQTESANRRQFKLLTRLSHHFLDVIAGLPTLKLFGRARAQAATIRRISDDQRRLTMRTLRIAFLSSLVLELLATLSVALVAVGIGLRLVDGRLDLATALLVLILAPEAYLPLRQVGANYHASAEGLAAAEEAFAILDTPATPTGTPSGSAPSEAAPSGSAPSEATRSGSAPGGVIAFEDVVVRYRDSDALRLTAVIEPGEIVALTGPSGCGKSTALNVLLGFAVGSGRVTVGGADLASVDPDAWRSRIAWVPQRPHLFGGTVRENIALGAGPDADVVTAAHLAGAHTFILGLPQGYDTVLGDDGTGLSAGQRQRIALARAFLRDAPIVLLDEPTANLDAATADQVMAAIRRLAHGRTVLIAAHRPELIALAGRVVDLTPAGALATGTPAAAGSAGSAPGYTSGNARLISGAARLTSDGVL
ncbi:thiol reductant ABC exporter subunit CydD [Paractinoplanes atraurantiacus]|uniref:ATP-binding cassette, subfamily C, CydD/ATP-binding cassette, subfamily C, CydCD n=1 Tax=Paractinoplanes atraurantiacus TaxID=1036182 RepID=A0A285KES9_9ACTN|nr:thiol reductant ABC exporter subunit CydD [Actinoplanes atraurantiacus]SNY71120.1 ATP-binding cassette, subfamily C, CydD/ATP-binding cassette, subfamily C, CydCD [Actinoplanes atraurantiacus]